jgi:hypothetical protein
MSIASSVSYRLISSQFGVGHKSVERHVNDGHVTQVIQQSYAAREEARGLDVVNQLVYINSVTLDILKEARDNKKNGMALFAVDRIIKQLELQAKLLGDIDTPQVNIILMPEWVNIRTTIVKALIPYPDARIAVASALVQMEGEHASVN